VEAGGGMGARVAEEGIEIEDGEGRRFGVGRLASFFFFARGFHRFQRLKYNSVHEDKTSETLYARDDRTRTYWLLA
jgi:hypothetical protein